MKNALLLWKRQDSVWAQEGVQGRGGEILPPKKSTFSINITKITFDNGEYIIIFRLFFTQVLYLQI